MSGFLAEVLVSEMDIDVIWVKLGQIPRLVLILANQGAIQSHDFLLGSDSPRYEGKIKGIGQMSWQIYD